MDRHVHARGHELLHHYALHGHGLHNVNLDHEYDRSHIHGYAPVNHTGLDGYYTKYPYNRDHKSKTTPRSLNHLVQRYCLHGALFHLHEYSLVQYSYSHHVLTPQHVMQLGFPTLQLPQHSPAFHHFQCCNVSQLVLHNHFQAFV
ncbi:Uncharacterised protein [Acinetobacter baumannii]|nr:Uncharacterised protein [Acinetobacter baumannii]SSS38949.1 Uncharacterised protein [Acinetobacter baumannii]SSU16668.1 Uncharacterised protein [Acinetobacter baumannii]SVK02429.1 Uncharacterised protein [Acinetobacter baumannii]